jgi:hypothetical protein
MANRPQLNRMARMPRCQILHAHTTCTAAICHAAQARFQRFAPLLAELFPELATNQGLIEFGAGCAAMSQSGSASARSPTCASQSSDKGGPRAGEKCGGSESAPMCSAIYRMSALWCCSHLLAEELVEAGRFVKAQVAANRLHRQGGVGQQTIGLQRQTGVDDGLGGHAQVVGVMFYLVFGSKSCFQRSAKPSELS